MGGMDQLHPASWTETSDGTAAPTSCFGPLNIRNQPSRETPGILLQNKYIPETDPSMSVNFNLPFRNSISHVDMLKIMYDKLNPEQQTVINNKIAEITKDSVIIDSTASQQSIFSLYPGSNVENFSTVSFGNYVTIIFWIPRTSSLFAKSI